MFPFLLERLLDDIHTRTDSASGKLAYVQRKVEELLRSEGCQIRQIALIFVDRKKISMLFCLIVALFVLIVLFFIL